MNKLLIFALLATLCTMSLAQSESEGGFTVDQASQLLNDLLSDSQQSLEDLQANWDANEPTLEALIDNLETQVSSKKEECHALHDVLSSAHVELAGAQKYAAWLHERITENNHSIVNLLEKRCAQNGIYIEGLKNDKIALKLVHFLRQQIENKESFDFAQKKVFMKSLTAFISAYKTGNLAALIQLEKDVDASQFEVNVNTDVHGRSEEEIGSDHVDNNQSDLALEGLVSETKGWLQIQAELIDLLNNLEATVSAKIAQAQNDEVSSNVATAEYKLKLEQEIQVFGEELEKVLTSILGYEGAVASAQANLDQCAAEESDFEIQLGNAQTNLETQEADYNAKVVALNEEIATFNDVISLYGASLGSDDESKSRVDDYADNQTFDNNDDYAAETSQIDLINSF